MLYFVLVFIIEICLLEISKAFSLMNNTDLSSWIFVIVNILFVLVYLFVLKSTKYSIFFFIALLLRVAALIFNYYVLRFMETADSEGFHQVALQNQYSTIQSSYTNYTIFLTIIYGLTDSSRIIAQYISVLMGLGNILIIGSILNLLNVSYKTSRIVLIILSFQIAAIIFTCGLGRESWEWLFITASVFYFIEWFMSGKGKYIFMNILCVLLSASMHSGVLFILWGYIISYLTYSPIKKKIKVSMLTMVNMIILAICIFIFLPYLTFFAERFQNLDVQEALMKNVNVVNVGGSAYLSWMSASNIWECLLFSPLTIFYFFFSPIPFDWRNFQDIVVFCLDSTIYIWLFYQIYKKNKKLRDNQLKLLVRYLLISIISLAFIFSFGTKNSGTAMRHRLKIIPLIFVVYAIVTDGSKTRKTIKETNIIGINGK